MTTDVNNVAGLGKAMPPFSSGHGGGNTFVPFYLEPQ